MSNPFCDGSLIPMDGRFATAPEQAERERRRKLAPGSGAAIKYGCTCPVWDNHHGAGMPGPDGEPLYWFTADCPLHGPHGNNPTV